MQPRDLTFPALSSAVTVIVVACGGSSGAGDPGTGTGGADGGSPLPEPTVTSFTPEFGPWGTNVTLEGEDLGGTPTFQGPSEEGVAISRYTGSTPTSLGFRVPFPAEGALHLESSWWSVPAGDFTPTWQLAGAADVPAVTTVLSAISRAPRQLSVLFSGDPAVVLHLEDGELIEDTLVFPANAAPSTRRLYVTEGGAVAAFALTTDTPAVILDARRSDAGEWSVESTGIETIVDPADDVVVAGGRGGGVVWFRTWLDAPGGMGGAAGSSGADDTAAWARARSVDGHWTIDREPIADPAYGRRGYAAGATSDGSLYVAQAADASALFDTMEEPRLRRLGPQDAAFGPALPAGNRVDDYVTSITLADRGEGLVVGYCASDTGVFSAPTDTCREGLAPAEGPWIPYVPREGASTRHALTRASAASFVCEDDELELRVFPSEIEEPVSWPCPLLLTSAVDPEGNVVALVRVDDRVHAFLPRVSE